MPRDSRVIRELFGLFLLVTGGLGTAGGIVGLYVGGAWELATTILGLLLAAVGYGLTRYEEEPPTPVE